MPLVEILAAFAFLLLTQSNTPFTVFAAWATNWNWKPQQTFNSRILVMIAKDWLRHSTLSNKINRLLLPQPLPAVEMESSTPSKLPWKINWFVFILKTLATKLHFVIAVDWIIATLTHSQPTNWQAGKWVKWWVATKMRTFVLLCTGMCLTPDVTGLICLIAACASFLWNVHKETVDGTTIVH